MMARHSRPQGNSWRQKNNLYWPLSGANAPQPFLLSPGPQTKDCPRQGISKQWHTFSIMASVLTRVGPSPAVQAARPYKGSWGGDGGSGGDWGNWGQQWRNSGVFYCPPPQYHIKYFNSLPWPLKLKICFCSWGWQFIMNAEENLPQGIQYSPLKNLPFSTDGNFITTSPAA